MTKANILIRLTLLFGPLCSADELFTTIDYAGASATWVYGINNTGTITGAHGPTPGYNGFTLDGGGSVRAVAAPGVLYVHIFDQ